MNKFYALLLAVACSISAPCIETRFFEPGENLIVDGVPKIPTSLVAEIESYSEFRGAQFYSWHPLRREMLINTRFSDVGHVHLVKMPGGDRKQLTFRRDAALSASFQPTHGDYFIFSRDSNGTENFQKYRFDIATSKITLLTDGKSRSTGLLWNKGGTRMIYSSNKRNGKDMDIWSMDPLKPSEAKLVLECEGGAFGALAWSPDGRTLLLRETLSINESYLFLLDLETGKKTPFTERGSEPVAYGGAEFSSDGRGFFIETDRDSEVVRVAYVSLDTKQHSYLTRNAKWSVDDFALSKDGAHIAYTLNEDGASVLHVVDMQGNELPVPKLAFGQIAGLRWHANNKDLGFSYQNVRTPQDAYSFNIDSGKIERWTESETGGLDCSRFAEPELVKWSSFDGREISAFLFTPPASFKGKRPVLVNVHGGPEGQSRPGFMGRNNYLLDKMGIAMIFPNIRGSTGYGKSFLKLDNGFHREDAYKDLSALFDWIKTRSELDCERIMVMGGSYGGHMTLVAATHYADKIRCAQDIVGMSNLATMLKNTSGYRQDLRRAEYGDERDPKMHEYMNRLAPLNNADKARKPLFVVQGQNDPRVPKSEADQMVEAVKKNGTPVWYIVGKNEGHGFSNAHNKNYLFYATVLFMRQYLLN